MKIIATMVVLLMCGVWAVQAADAPAERSTREVTLVEEEPVEEPPVMPVERSREILFEDKVRYGGLLGDLVRGEDFFRTRKPTVPEPVEQARYLSIDPLTGRPRGIVLFSWNF